MSTSSLLTCDNNSSNQKISIIEQQKPKQTAENQEQLTKHRQGITLIYDLLKAMMDAYKPMPKTRIYQAAQLNGAQGPRILKRALMLGYVRPCTKKGIGGCHGKYINFELTQDGITHIYNIEQFHHNNGVILRSSRTFGS